MGNRQKEQKFDIFNFSFLDILACTVGALIFILVMFMVFSSVLTSRAVSPERKRDLVSRIQEFDKEKAALEQMEKDLNEANLKAAGLGDEFEVAMQQLKKENIELEYEKRKLDEAVAELEQKVREIIGNK